MSGDEPTDCAQAESKGEWRPLATRYTWVMLSFGMHHLFGSKTERGNFWQGGSTDARRAWALHENLARQSVLPGPLYLFSSLEGLATVCT